MARVASDSENAASVELWAWMGIPVGVHSNALVDSGTPHCSGLTLPGDWG